MGTPTQDLRKGKAHSSTLSDLGIEPGAEHTFKAVEIRSGPRGCTVTVQAPQGKGEDMGLPHDGQLPGKRTQGLMCALSTGEIEPRPHSGGQMLKREMEPSHAEWPIEMEPEVFIQAGSH